MHNIAEALREEVRCFGNSGEITIPARKTYAFNAAMRPALGSTSRQGRRGAAGRTVQEARCDQPASCKLSAKRRAPVLAIERGAGDATDFAAVDPQIVQLAARHTAQLGDRLTIFAPVVEGACDVHDDPLSRARYPAAVDLATVVL